MFLRTRPSQLVTKSHSIGSVRWRVLPFFLALLIHTNAAAQVTGRLSGIVEDAAGKGVAGARVTLALAESPIVYAATVTSRTGVFFFPVLNPLSYDLTVEAANFLRQTLKNIKVDPAAATSLAPIRMAPGDASKEAGATAPELTLQTSSVAVASTASYEQASRLPLPLRDPLFLAETLPGVQDNGRAPGAADTKAGIGQYTNK